MSGWLTNSPSAAAALRKADERYTCARLMAESLRLAEKIEALRAAKAARQADYDAIAKGDNHA